MLFTVSSCDEKLDINDNPNSPIDADVNLVLPNAIVASASISNQFNSYGGHFGGYIANAGGFSGFGTLLTYNLTPGDYNALWVNTFQDPLKDLKYVIDKTEGSDQYAYFNAAAKIMSVVNYQRLVDTFGDIPYSQSLRGEEGITAPEYDDAGEVYQDLFATLDEAITLIEDADFPLNLTRASDPLFGSNTSTERPIADQMLDWKKYANTLKLRILLRLSGNAAFSTFVTTGFANLDVAGIGFLTDDAIIDPGYEKNRPNPTWNSWGRTTTDALSNSSRIPTTYSFAFFNGAKISDSGRGETLFVNFPTTPHNQLGNEVGNPTIVAGQVTWASNQTGLTGSGVLKGPAQGQPLMLLAEAKFLQAEAELKGFIAGTYTTTYYDGIRASFAYLYKDENENILAGFNPTTLKDAYVSTNAGNRLVEIEVATTDAQRLEAIITQKYISMLMVTSDESWNEYRRTGFPATVPGGAPALDIASNKSNVTTRADRLPTRVMYPSSEQSFNTANYVVIDYTSDLIFWDPN